MNFLIWSVVYFALFLSVLIHFLAVLWLWFGFGGER